MGAAATAITGIQLTPLRNGIIPLMAEMRRLKLAAGERDGLMAHRAVGPHRIAGLAAVTLRYVLFCSNALFITTANDNRSVHPTPPAHALTFNCIDWELKSFWQYGGRRLPDTKAKQRLRDRNFVSIHITSLHKPHAQQVVHPVCTAGGMAPTPTAPAACPTPTPS